MCSHANALTHQVSVSPNVVKRLSKRENRILGPRLTLPESESLAVGSWGICIFNKLPIAS